MKQSEGEKMCTFKEACEALGYGRIHLLGAIEDGRIKGKLRQSPYDRFDYLIAPEEVAQELDRQTQAEIETVEKRIKADQSRLQELKDSLGK
jgi:hypothetical protein